MIAAQDLSDTIVALATPPGVGAIGVIRLSGREALVIADKLFHGRKLAAQATHTAHFGTIRDGDRILDEVLATIFIAPRSYTGEHVVELSCHGSPYIIQEIIQLCIREGARLAKPGEFTLRAFLNGKMDLSQAEAVADLIASSTEAAHQIALQQMRGGFSDEIQKLRQQLIDFASLIELELDFGEEDVEFADRTELKQLIHRIQELIRKLLDSFRLGNAIKEGVTTVIAGRPNAGKSTILNALLNEERAIVSDIAGTTRDTIEEVLNIQGIPFRIVDTAGIRDAEDTIEAIGVARTMEKVRQSAVLVYVFDVIETSPEEVRADLAKLVQPGMYVLVVANKMDLNPYTKWEHYFRSSPNPSSLGGGGGFTSEPISEETVIFGRSIGKWRTANPNTYKDLKEKARELRKNMTPAEKHLWARIRRRQIEDCEFRRQHIVGYFIPDFLCLEHKLIIEIDGGYHQLQAVQLRDEDRTRVLEKMGYTVIRFSNEEVMDKTREVLAKITQTLRTLKSSTDKPETSKPDSPMVNLTPPPPEEGIGKEHWVPLSAINQMNIPYLKEKLYEAVIREEVQFDSTIVSNARHYEALRKADQSLSDVLRGMEEGVTSDFVALDIRQALYHLGEITGEISTDDLLGNIFGKFCIGK